MQSGRIEYLCVGDDLGHGLNCTGVVEQQKREHGLAGQRHLTLARLTGNRAQRSARTDQTQPLRTGQFYIIQHGIVTHVGVPQQRDGLRAVQNLERVIPFGIDLFGQRNPAFGKDLHFEGEGCGHANLAGVDRGSRHISDLTAHKAGTFGQNAWCLLDMCKAQRDLQEADGVLPVGTEEHDCVYRTGKQDAVILRQLVLHTDRGVSAKDASNVRLRVGDDGVSTLGERCMNGVGGFKVLQIGADWFHVSFLLFAASALCICGRTGNMKRGNKKTRP